MTNNRLGCCIAIVVMGRSGTSAFAGALRLLGVHFGANLIATDELNPKGYFENSAVLAINRALLREIGSYHGDFQSLHLINWQTPSLSGLRETILDLLNREFSNTSLFAIKDPRLGRVWPVWAAAIEQAGGSFCSAILLRHPIEVVQSLHKLGVSINHGLLWWIAYMLDAERNSHPTRRYVLPYDELLIDPEKSFLKVAESLRIVWPASVDCVAPALAAFLDSSLRHFSETMSTTRRHADSALLAFAERIHSAMFRGADRLEMDSLRAEYEVMAGAYAGWRFPVL